MESVYRSYDSNATDKLHIKEYFNEYTNLIRYKFNKNDADTFTNIVDIPLPPDELKELENRCSIDLLDSEGITVSYDNRRSTAITEDVQLSDNESLETLKKLKEKYTSYAPKLFKPSLKYQCEHIVNYTAPITTGHKAKPGEDVLIFIRVYNPFSSMREDGARVRQKITLAHVIVLLGQQTLAHLRNHIPCLADLSAVKECSKNPFEYAEVANKDVYKSSFFYIENTFYNDMTDKDNHDNSLVIREWAEKRGFGPFHTAVMEETRLDALTVRFGYPWVFQHQGNCEHLIVFSDARLVIADDDLAIANYPRIHRTKPFKYPVCMMCSERSAQWIIFESNRIPLEPSYHCQMCFVRFNYIKGQKVGNFKAYRYPYDPALMKVVQQKM